MLSAITTPLQDTTTVNYTVIIYDGIKNHIAMNQNNIPVAAQKALIVNMK
jgi:hypothetical protein